MAEPVGLSARRQLRGVSDLQRRQHRSGRQRAAVRRRDCRRSGRARVDLFRRSVAVSRAGTVPGRDRIARHWASRRLRGPAHSDPVGVRSGTRPHWRAQGPRDVRPILRQPAEALTTFKRLTADFEFRISSQLERGEAVPFNLCAGLHNRTAIEDQSPRWTSGFEIASTASRASTAEGGYGRLNRVWRHRDAPVR